MTLKTPIANINMLSRILEEQGGIASTQKDILELIQESATSLLTFIDGILNRCKTPKEQDKITDTNSLVQRVIKMIAATEDITINIENKLPKIKTDQLILQQAFQNLITNAIKYNDKKEPQIQISSYSNACYHSFTVTDNGRGIPADKLSDIFKQNFVAGGHDRFGNNGTGPGLYNFKKSLQEIGGRIEAVSDQYERSKFTFHIPA